MIQCYEIFPSCQNVMRERGRERDNNRKTVCQCERVIIGCECVQVCSNKTNTHTKKNINFWEGEKSSRKTELIKSYIYSRRNKETTISNQERNKAKQKKTEFIHSYLASEKERDDERSARARRMSGTESFSSVLSSVRKLFRFL